jgi:type I restriction enzyme R subunit
MTLFGYTEDALIERPAIALLAELGWETFNAYGEFDHGASTPGRETKGEVVLKTRLREALLRFNPEVPVEAVHQAIEELICDRSRMSMVAANRELIARFEKKIQATLARVWGEDEPDQAEA